MGLKHEQLMNTVFMIDAHIHTHTHTCYII